MDDNEKLIKQARKFVSDHGAYADNHMLRDLADALERATRGARTLGEIVARQVEDTLRWAGMEDQIGTDDPDQQLAWEICAEMPERITALEAERAALIAAGVVAEEPEGEHVFIERFGMHSATLGGIGGDVQRLVISREAWKALGEADVLAVSVVPANQEGSGHEGDS